MHYLEMCTAARIREQRQKKKKTFGIGGRKTSINCRRRHESIKYWLKYREKLFLLIKGNFQKLLVQRG